MQQKIQTKIDYTGWPPPQKKKKKKKNGQPILTKFDKIY